MWFRILVVVLLFLNIKAYSQASFERCTWISVFDNPVELDSLTVFPESISVADSLSEIVSWTYDASFGFITLHADATIDSIELCYRTFPYQLHNTQLKRSLLEYNVEYSKKNRKNGPDQNLIGQREELFPTDELQKSGSLSRGLSFGNTQNVVFNSALNLQLEGKLSDDINIRASITDQNVPFQPEGNTAQIQDFDNIFIELYNKNFSLRGGDILLQNKSSNFLKYYKNVQGGMATATYDVSEKSTAETSLGISVAKGKFASIQLEVDEGISGPYRIRVPNTNDFIIILANSEKVYVDGKLMSRGYNNDYVIDYNKAEIHFTSRVLITKFSRVRIDVEYSDRNYSRSIIAANHYQDIGKVNLFFNYYSEKDNPNRPLTFNLTDEDKALMSLIGDDLDKAVTISAQESAYNQDLIQYELLDTMDIQGNPIQYFLYSTNENNQLYTVVFNEPTSGDGNYIQKSTTLNGRVYEWVAPVGGQPQGTFEPVSKIPAPNRKDMITVGGGVDITKYDEIYSEIAFSTQDLNLFSNLDTEDDHGKALKVGYRSKSRPIGFMKDYRFTADLNYEYDDQYFTPIDRYRYIEFDRDWNYNPTATTDKTEDHILNVEFEIQKDFKNKLSYLLTRRKRGDFVDGFQQHLDVAKKLGRIEVTADVFAMNNHTSEFDANWLRFSGDVNFQSKIFVPGYRFNLDRNTIVDPAMDSVMATAMNYAEHVFYVKSQDTLKTQFGLTYAIREDRAPQSGELVKSNDSKTAKFFIRSRFNKNQDLNVLFTYRNNVNYQVPSGPQNEETIITRVDWFGQFFDRHVRSDLSYAVGNGRELKREFVYVQAQAGQGTHTWRDDNGDGIQDLGEFYLAINPDERNYIKIFVPTNEFVFAYENNFNYRLNIDLPRNWKKSLGFKRFLSKFSNTTSLSSIKKTTNSDLLSRFLPFYNDIPEEDILSVRESIRSRLFFNRTNPGFGFDLGFVQTGNKQLLTNGFEERATRQYSLNARVNVSKTYNSKIFLSRSLISSSSDFLNGRNYLVSQYKIAPELAWQPSNNFRITTQYALTDKDNIHSENMNETARLQEVNVSFRYTKAAKQNMSAIFRYINIDFNGEENTPVGYEMLEALRPGGNFTWNLVFQRKIINGLQLTLNYEGRKSEGSSVVNIGRMQITALF